MRERKRDVPVVRRDFKAGRCCLLDFERYEDIAVLLNCRI